MFRCNERNNSGFQIDFANGYAVSVQWGIGTYSDNNVLNSPDALYSRQVSSTAEVAMFYPEGPFVRLTEHDDVAGYVSPEKIAMLLNFVAHGDIESAEALFVD